MITELIELAKNLVVDHIATDKITNAKHITVCLLDFEKFLAIYGAKTPIIATLPNPTR